MIFIHFMHYSSINMQIVKLRIEKMFFSLSFSLLSTIQFL